MESVTGDAGALGWGLLGTQVDSVRHARVRLLGCDVDLFYRLDAEQDDYRRSVGAEALVRLGDLDCLLGLPVGMPVALSGLTDRERLLLRKVPRWAASTDRGAVVRHARFPLHADLVVARGSTWRSAVRRAGRFVPYCRRVALADRPPVRDEDAAAARMEAAYYGIGLVWAGPATDASGTDACAPGWFTTGGCAAGGLASTGLDSEGADSAGCAPKVAEVPGRGLEGSVPTGSLPARPGSPGRAPDGPDSARPHSTCPDSAGRGAAPVVLDVAPAAHSPLHRSPVQWEFAEAAYAALRRLGAVGVSRVSRPSASARATDGMAAQGSPPAR
ncbi:hypothetical protein [Murinocardiopsis flavida]|nr:hypothetical protein [Murinocardiopsis flavida]